MYFNSLHLKNFKGFAQFECKFPANPGAVVIIGENGAGKTALLDALAVCAGSLFLALDGGRQRPIYPEEIRRAPVGQTGSMELQTPTRVRCSAMLDGTKLTWTRGKHRADGRTRRKQAASIIQYAENLAAAVKRGDSVRLPLLAYLGTGRLWLQKKERDVPTNLLNSRLRGYLDCLDSAQSPKLLFQWWRDREWEEYQRKEKLTTLGAVKEAVLACLQGAPTTAQVTAVRFDVRLGEVAAFFADGRELPFSQLSDGYRTVLGMVADLAYRAAVLNAHLGAAAARETTGVVLVDEIDLHLHPNWQRRILTELQRAFPRIQFIVTTHSPFIVQSLAPEAVLNLERCPTPDQRERSIEDIAEHEMGVALPQRSERYRQMLAAATEYYQVLGEAKGAQSQQLEALKQRLDQLALPFSDNPAYHAFLMFQRARSGIDGEGHAPR